MQESSALIYEMKEMRVFGCGLGISRGEVFASERNVDFSTKRPDIDKRKIICIIYCRRRVSNY